MKITSNYSLTHSFASKTVYLFLDGHIAFSFNLPTLTKILSDAEFNITLNTIFTKPELFSKKANLQSIKNSFDFIKIILFQLGQFLEYREIYTCLLNKLPEIFNNLEIDFKNKTLKFNNVTMTEEIWEYVLYILHLSYGEKVSEPQTFDSPEARQWYLAQKELDDKISNLRSKNGSQENDGTHLAKILLSIVYAFPSMSIDYLMEQTMAQIQWLQKYAAGSVSYEVNAQAFAAGNMKKGKKLDFFIK